MIEKYSWISAVPGRNLQVSVKQTHRVTNPGPPWRQSIASNAYERRNNSFTCSPRRHGHDVRRQPRSAHADRGFFILGVLFFLDLRDFFLASFFMLKDLLAPRPAEENAAALKSAKIPDCSSASWIDPSP
ncbi:MAG: hypothetical protein V4731_14765 [Pseudomonadota bacterium]